MVLDSASVLVLWGDGSARGLASLRQTPMVGVVQTLRFQWRSVRGQGWNNGSLSRDMMPAVKIPAVLEEGAGGRRLYLTIGGDGASELARRRIVLQIAVDIVGRASLVARRVPAGCGGGGVGAGRQRVAVEEAGLLLAWAYFSRICLGPLSGSFIRRDGEG